MWQTGKEVKSKRSKKYFLPFPPSTPPSMQWKERLVYSLILLSGKFNGATYQKESQLIALLYFCLFLSVLLTVLANRTCLNTDSLTLTKQINLHQLRTSHKNKDKNVLSNSSQRNKIQLKSKASEKRRGCMARPRALVYTGVCSQSAAFHIR